MAIEFLKIIGTSLIPPDVTCSLYIIIILSVFTIVYFISFMGTKEQTYEEAMAAQRQNFSKNNRPAFFSIFLSKSNKDDDPKHKIFKKRGKLSNNNVKDNKKAITHSNSNFKKSNFKNGNNNIITDKMESTNPNTLNDVIEESVIIMKEGSNVLVDTLNLDINDAVTSLIKNSDIILDNSNQEDVMENIENIKNSANVCKLSHFTNLTDHQMLNGVDRIISFESTESSSNEISTTLTCPTKDNLISTDTQNKGEKRQRKKNKKGKNVIPIINGLPLFDVQNYYIQKDFVNPHLSQNKDIKKSILKKNSNISGKNDITKPISISKSSDIPSMETVPLCSSGNADGEEGSCTNFTETTLSENCLIAECANLSPRKLCGLLDKLIDTYKVDITDIETVRGAISFVQNHVTEFETKLHQSQAMILNANLQIQKLSDDNGQEGIKYAKLENLTREKIMSLTQDLKMLHSRLNEAQSFQHKVINMQKVMEESTTNHNLAVKTLTEENKRFQDNYHQRDNEVKSMEKKLQQMEISFTKDLDSNIKAYDDKVNYLAKQNEKLANQMKLCEQDNIRIKEQLQAVANEKTHAIAKCEELAGQLRDTSREIEVVREKNRTLNLMEKDVRDREDTFFGDIRAQLKGIRSDLNVPKELLLSFFKSMPVKDDQRLAEICSTVSRDTAKNYNFVLGKVENLDSTLGEMTRSLNHLCVSIMEREEKNKVRDLQANNGKDPAHTAKMLSEVKLDITKAIDELGQTFQNKENGSFQINEMVQELQNINKNFEGIKCDLLMKNKVENLNLKTSLNESTSYIDLPTTSTSSPKFNDKILMEVMETNIEQLKIKNNELREKNWKIIEALKDKESYLSRYIIEGKVDRKEIMNVKLAERNEIIKLLQTGCNLIGIQFSPASVSNIENDSFYTKINEVFLASLVESYTSNKNLIRQLKEKNDVFQINLMEMSKAKSVLEKELIMSKENTVLINETKNKKIKHDLELIIIRFKEGLLTLKKRVEENEQYLDAQIMFQTELLKNNGSVQELSLSKPFVFPLTKDLNPSDLKEENNVCKRNNLDNDKDIMNHPSLKEPWVEIIIEPLADPALLKELEMFKMKLQNLQRELMALQCINENSEINSNFSLHQ